jgi:hypothetical protein
MWMLRRIYAIAGDHWVAFLTDDDSAMMVAVPQFLKETCANMRHYLCVFHKFKNICKHINHLTSPQPTKLSLLNFTQSLCFSKTITKADDALEKMHGTAPEPVHYVDANIRTLLSQFADCCKGEWLILGYRATSLAESANAMIRRYTPNRLLSLTEMRRPISTAHRFKRHNQVQDPFLSPRMRELVTEADLHIEKNILDWLERSMNQSTTMRVQKEGGTFVVLSGRSRYEVLSDNLQCRYPIM